MVPDRERRFAANLTYRVAVLGNAGFLVVAGALSAGATVGSIGLGWVVAGIGVAAVAVRACRTGVVLDGSAITIRNFLTTKRVPWSELRWIGLDEVGAGRIVWRLSNATALRIDTTGGTIVRSYCLTEGPRLVPAPRASTLATIVALVGDR